MTRPKGRRVRIGRRPRPLRRAIIAVGLIVLIGVAWIAARGLLAARDLRHSRTEISAARAALTHGDSAAALGDLQSATSFADRAVSMTTDPVWHLAEHLPLLGVNLRTVHAVSSAAAATARGTTPLVRQLATDLTTGALRESGGGINLTAVAALGPTISQTLASLNAAAGQLQATPTGAVGPLASARTQLLAQLTSFDATVTAAQRVVSLAPPMLGAAGERHYLIALQNPAEARGTGGYLGAFAVISADRGRLKLVDVGTDDQLVSPATPVVTVSPEFTARWRPFGGDSYWGNANLTPDFPDAATVWEALYTKDTHGQHVDGVIAIDPAATGDLVSAIGGVTLPDGTRLAGPDVDAYLESGEYLRYPTDLATRRVQVRALVSSTFGKVTAGDLAPLSIVSALSKSVAAGQVLLASTHPDEETTLTAGGVAGALPDTAGPYASLFVDNAGGNKMDYYLDRTLSYRSLGCDTPTRPATITVTLHNTAPTSGLPLYVAGYDGRNPIGHFADGTDRSLVSVYAALGATLDSSTLDGTPVVLTPGIEHEHPVFTTYVNIPPGATRTLTLHLTEPARGALMPTITQPLARPERLVLQTDSCYADAPLPGSSAG